MATTNQFTTPLMVDADGSNAISLERIPIQATGESYDERWLQGVLYRNPALIPTEEIEPVFGGAVPVCMELPTNVGPLDLVYINDQGLLTLVECKLWRNPEARRTVVGQILDYAQEISRWSYDELDSAIARNKSRTGSSLWEIARVAFGLDDEAMFIDRVSRHLRTGSFLLVIVGDGIRENTENITAYLQQHGGLRFTFGLVEERLFSLPGNNQILVQPRILAKTVELGRFVVVTETGAVSTENSSPTKDGGPRLGRTQTEAIFIEEVAGNSKLAEELRSFFTRLKEAGFNLEPTGRGVGFKVVPEGMKQNLLTISNKGTIRNYGCGNTYNGKHYLSALNCFFPDSQVWNTPDNGWSSTIQRQDGKPFRVEDMLRFQDELIETFRGFADFLRAEELE